MTRDTTPTDRRAYDRPEIGADWAQAWDGLVEDLDKDVPQSDTIANRPASGTYDDELFYATDQEILYRWDADASDWIPAGTGTSQDPVPGTSHFESVNTEDLGLAGDRENPFVSNQPDFSDVSTFYQSKSSSSSTNHVLLDISDGPKTVMGISGRGSQIRTTAGAGNKCGPITVDGTVNSTYPGDDGHFQINNDGSESTSFNGFGFIYQSSLKIEWQHNGSGRPAWLKAHILGSGPHWVAIVADGKEPHSVGRNLSDDQISSMSAPDGYSIVKNPDTGEVNNVFNGVWDASNSKFVQP